MKCKSRDLTAGQGKTTLANAVVRHLNQMTQARYGVAVAQALSMDGFHLSRQSLDMFSDPGQAHRRRGAPSTFDVDGLHSLIVNLRQPVAGDSAPVLAPSFDHHVKV